jgi:hypothetical protein
MAYTNIDDPSAHFQTAIYTGDGNDDKAITNDGNSDLKPDLVWLKDRTQAESHAIFDSSRGASVRLQPNNQNAESTESATQKSFTTDGFTVGTSGSVNNGSNPDKYAAWQWKANGGTTSSNTDGSITSTVQANTDAGFSIVTYTGTGSAATVGHGLGVTPDMIIFKNRSGANVWATYHQSLGNNLKLELNGTGAQDADGAFMNGTLPTSSVFSVGASANTNTGSSNYIAYAFAQKQGYSKFGKYVGNGSTDGAFIYTGFKPAFVLFKNSSNAGENWIMYDNKRDPHNEATLELFPNDNSAEYTGNAFDIDMLSNGFKHRGSNTGSNGSGRTYIYMAFAENPFTTSTGIPTTAR